MTRLEYTLLAILVIIATLVAIVLTSGTQVPQPRTATCYSNSGDIIYTGRVCYVYSAIIDPDELRECETNRRVQVNLDQCVIVSDP